jgi:membrane-associated phospholipid phosphatase
MPVFVALSRIYRGEHHPTDILGSLLFSALWLTATVLLIKPNADGRPGQRDTIVDRQLTRREPSPSPEPAGPR